MYTKFTKPQREVKIRAAGVCQPSHLRFSYMQGNQKVRRDGVEVSNWADGETEMFASQVFILKVNMCRFSAEKLQKEKDARRLNAIAFRKTFIVMACLVS